MKAVILLALAAVVVAQKPTPCSGPTQFTGRFRFMDRTRNIYVEGGVVYDEENRRVREFEYEKLGSDVVVYDKLKLYNLDTEYRVDLKTRKCNVTRTHPFRPYGVPPEARYAGQGTIGAIGVPNEAVTISTYIGEFDGRDPFMVAVTEPDCYPVEFAVYSNTSGFEHREFYDLVAGITDPNAFVPPRECLTPP